MPDSEHTDCEYDSEYDIEYDDDESRIFYEPEEQSLTRYNISSCELYNRKLHGNANSDILYHYLVHCRYKILDMECINDISNNINKDYLKLDNKNHDIFRNYKHIITNKNYIKPEIIECIYLDTYHCVAILKTFWMRLIQRKWKNIIKERVNIINRRSNLKSLTHRELTGKWPNDCLIFPQLRGMLSQLKN